MQSMLARLVCRILAASMLILPFQAQAGLIGSDRAASAPTVTNAISRGELAAQLQMLGLSPEAAAERVASLTDGEIAGLAGRVDQLPAGGVAGLLWIAVVVFLIWRFTASDRRRPNPRPGTRPRNPPRSPRPRRSSRG